MAENYKTSGNACFLAGNYEEAAKLYEKAVSLAPDNAVYLSNLSAAQFELGQYDECAATILRTAPFFSNSPDPLKRKLSHRLARALCHIRMIGTSTAFATVKETAAFENYAREQSASDLCAFWDLWRDLQVDDVAKRRQDAQHALSEQALFKNTQANFGIEYYNVGHDDAQTLLTAEPFVPDIKLSQFLDSQLSALSFLFGGCGDCRHVLGTLIDIHQESLDLNAAQKRALHVHMTLIDIHPTTVARVLLNLTLLSQLADALGTGDEEEAVATFLYTFISPILPSYVQARASRAMEEIIQQLETSSLPEWIAGPFDTRPVIASLRYWLQLKVDTGHFIKNVGVHLNQPVEDFMLSSMLNNSLHVPPEFLDSVRASQVVSEARALDMHRSMPVEKLRMLFPSSNRMTDAQVRAHIEKAVKKNLPYFTDRPAKLGMQDEQAVYPKIKTILPSSTLLKRYHKAMSPLVKDLQSMMINPYDLQDPPTGLPTKAALKGALTHLCAEWTANPIAFDRIMPKEPTGYPDCGWDVFTTIAGFGEYLDERIRDGSRANFRLMGQGGMAFEHGALFFRRAARAFKALRGKVVFEVVAGDVCSWMEKCQLGLARPGPGRPSFPTQFTRMWLSNVPDYCGGPLDIAVYAVPCLQPHPMACVTFNILLNNGSWTSVEQYNYHYALMGVKDMPGMLRSQVLSVSPNDNICVSRASEDGIEHPSRTDLTNWLMRLLVHLVYHGQASSVARIHTPNTLAFFVRVLKHMHFVGVPSHFLADILQNVLLDKIVSDVRPTKGPLPITPQGIHSGKQRKLHLSPWIPELEALVAQVRGALPFALHLPDNFPAAEDLVTCEVEAKIREDPSLGWQLRQPALALLLYAPHFELQRLSALYFGLLEGEHAKDAVVFTGFTINKTRTRVTWTMSYNLACALQSDGWKLTVFRLENFRQATATVPAKEWKVPARALDVETLD